MAPVVDGGGNGVTLAATELEHRMKSNVFFLLRISFPICVYICTYISVNNAICLDIDICIIWVYKEQVHAFATITSRPIIYVVVALQFRFHFAWNSIVLFILYSSPFTPYSLLSALYSFTLCQTKTRVIVDVSRDASNKYDFLTVSFI